jgi:hypothetical protein
MYAKSNVRPLERGLFAILAVHLQFIKHMTNFMHDWFYAWLISLQKVLKLCVKGYYGKKVHVLEVERGINVHQIVWYFDSVRIIIIMLIYITYHVTTRHVYSY